MAVFHLSIRPNPARDGEPYGHVQAWAEELGGDFDEWTGARGFVIVAGNEAEARALAADHRDHAPFRGRWWLEPTLTACTPVEGDTPRIVLIDTPRG